MLAAAVVLGGGAGRGFGGDDDAPGVAFVSGGGGGGGSAGGAPGDPVSIASPGALTAEQASSTATKVPLRCTRVPFTLTLASCKSRVGALPGHTLAAGELRRPPRA